MYYTIGQRKALMIGGQKGMPEAPWYVAKKDIQRNVLIVAQGHDHPSLFTKSLITTTVHWINTPPALPLKAMAKTRYRQADQVCLIESTDNERCQVTFQIPQRAITPGQSVVFYQDDQCLGGGVIACRDENR
ncbi:MAG: tRNA-specific 2-thiouridylase MnmA [uncultured bacterium]|nr:MAG: tRNA-specific 2-thiouridylase MnmA [uncultured bacterium]